MSKITRETLGLAALAAGMTPVRMSDDGRGLLVAERAEPWRPHADIADATRLALCLRAWARVTHDAVESNVPYGGGCLYGAAPHDGTEADKERAYCIAVVLCAEAKGRMMREGGQ